MYHQYYSQSCHIEADFNLADQIEADVIKYTKGEASSCALIHCSRSKIG